MIVGRRTWLAAALLGIAVWIVFGQVVGHEFLNFDDDAYVFGNPRVQDGLTLESIRWALSASHAANWHPLTWASHMLDVQWFGLDPGGHHVVNVFFHAANAVLLLLALMALTRTFWPSVFVAALFALHPLRAESVAWVSQRKDVLATLFWMSALLAYAWHARDPRPRRFLLVMLAMTLGLMSKPTVVTLPLALLLLDCWPLGRLRVWRADEAPAVTRRRNLRVLLEKLPLLALSAAAAVTTYLVQHKGGAGEALESVRFWPRLSNALVTYVTVPWKVVIPTELSHFYPHPAVVSADAVNALHVQGFVAALALGAVTFLVLRAAARSPYLAVGWFWYVITMLPMVGLIQVGAQARADRYTYLPAIGLTLMAVFGARDVLRRAGPTTRMLVGVGGGAVLAIYATATWHQVSHWRDDLTLTQHAVAVNPDNFAAFYHMGIALTNLGDFEEAAEKYREAVRIRPDHSMAHHNLAAILDQLGRPDEAIGHYEEAVRLDPDDFTILYHIGIALTKRGDLEEAAEKYEEAVRVRPDHAMIHHSLAAVLQQLRRPDEAIGHYEEAIRLDPDLTESHDALGMIALRGERFEEACWHLENAVRTGPDSVDATYHLGLALLMSGEPDAAEDLFYRVLEMNPELAAAHNNLGVVHLKRGELDQAAERFERALQIAPDYADARSNYDLIAPAEGGAKPDE